MFYKMLYVTKLSLLVLLLVCFYFDTKAEEPSSILSSYAINYNAEEDSSLRQLAKEEDNKATAFYKIGDYSSALIHLRKALDLYSQVSDSVQMAILYSDIANILKWTNGDAEKILQCYRESSSLLHDLGYKEDEIERLILIKDFLYQQGRYDEYADISQEISQKVSDIPPSADLYELLGQEQYKYKNYTEAIPYFEEAKALFEQDGYDDSYYTYVSVCILLATTYHHVQRYDDAIDLIYRIIELNEKNGKGNDPSSLYSNLLLLQKSLFALGKSDQAFECAEIAHQKLDSHLSAYARFIPYSLMLDACLETKNFEQIIDISVKADSVLTEEFPETDENRLYVMNLRVNALSQMNRFEEAIPLLLHIMQIKEPIYQVKTKERLDDLLRLANFEASYASDGNPQYMDSAKAHIAEYADIVEAEIRNQSPWLTSQQRNILWDKNQQALLQIAGFAVASKSVREPFIEEVYNAHLLGKGLLLHTDKAMADAITKHGTVEDKSALNQLFAVRDSIAEAERFQEISKKAKYQIKAQSIESLLLKQSPVASHYPAFLDTDFKKVHASLKKGEVLVDFLEVQHTESNGSTVTAFVIRPEWEYPHLMRVCRSSEIEGLAGSLNARIYEDSTSCAIQHLVLDSVLYYVNPGEILYYVPDGILHDIALENLINDEGKMLYDIYDMRRISSSREIAKMHSQANGNYKKAVLYGALDYGEYTSSAKTIETEDSGERGIGDAFLPLRATEYEIKTIDSILKKSKIHTSCYSKDQGTEESFLALDGSSPDIIHLATHGYYLSQEQAQKVKGLAGYTNAMDLSGLVMSGGNAGWLDAPTEDGILNGLLSAQDIAGLDLSQTRIVVLSACKTASGQTLADGIFGLQRAFKKAGAGSLIMTLWGVNDKATAQFMTFFYQELSKNKWNRHAAFNTAKKKIKELYTEPYYWAGFIMLD